MNEFYELKRYLEISIKKHGNQPLILQHLVNIMNLIEKKDADFEKWRRDEDVGYGLGQDNT